MAKLTLANVSNPENQTSLVNTINNNSDLIEAAIENTLSRDGSTPNTMEAPLDMNSNQILNLPLASSPTEPVRKGEFDLLQGALDDLNSAVDQAEAAQAAAEAAQAGAEAAEAGAQAAVEAAIDEFEDVYLGPKASDPLVDNDGDPLAEGMLYFNTVSNALKIYDGASWIAYSAATGLTEVADDTSPTLGGSLDGGGFDITNVDDATFDSLTVTDLAYNATTWNNSNVVPTRNAVRDEMELKLAITTAASTYQPLDAGLTALAAFNTNGILAQTADNTFAGRTITGTANKIDVTNGDGVSGNPTLTIPSGVVLVGPVLGTPASGTLTNCTGLPVASVVSDTSTALGVGSLNVGHDTDTTISRSSAGVIAVEGVALPTNIPGNSQSAAYTLVIGDAQKYIYHPSSDNNARTFTIPANASVAFPNGTAIMFINRVNVVTIAITSDTLTWAPTGATGSRSLAANGIAIAIKVSSTEWMITGVGIS